MVKSSYEISEITLSYKNKSDLSKRPKVTQSKDAYAIFLQAWDKEKIGFVEQAKVLLLNQANRVLGIYDLSTGGVTGTVCDPKLVFAAAIKSNACNVILAHNHPSENLQPSRADKQLTEKIKQAGETMDIVVLDHLIISPHGYYSISDDAAYNREDLGIAINNKHDQEEKPQSVAAESPVLSANALHTITAAYLQKQFIDYALSRSQLAYDAFLATWQQNMLDIQQSFRMFSLDKFCRTISLHTMPQGMQMNGYSDAEFLISLAAKENASYIVLAQNKRYGVILPKVADLDFAEMINAAGRDDDITLLDYLFVNKTGYYSYNDNEFHLSQTLRPA